MYEKIQDEWEKSNIVWFVTINELRKSRIIFERYSEYTLFFPKEIRVRIKQYYLKSENLISNLENFQNRKYAIENREKQILLDLKLKDLSVPKEQLEEKIKHIMENEQAEKLLIEKEIPKLIGKIESIKNEARNILNKVSYD